MGADQEPLPGFARPAPDDRGGGPTQARADDAVPRLKPLDRTQILLRTVVVEALIPEDHPARAIWHFVGQLDLSAFTAQIRAVDGGAGRPAFDPHLLVSLWVYSYSEGVSSARAIERLCDYHPAYQWLTEMEGISAHTLSDFRVAHADAVQDLFVQVLALLMAEGLITLERVMQDGTKVRASAASSEFRSQTRIEEYLTTARAAVEALEALTEEDAGGRLERARARAVRERQERLESALAQFAQLQAAKSLVTRVSISDPEARVMKQADGGSAPSYNVQIATDAAHGLIIDIEATQAGSDYRQLMPAVDRIAQHLHEVPDQMVVDGGYISNDNILAMSERGIDLVGPEARGAPTDADANRRKSYQYRGVQPEYESSQFIYEPESNVYRCPQGKRLPYDAKYPRDGTMRYRYMAAKEDCDACPAKRFCCPHGRHGRSIERREPLAAITAYRQKMQTDEARAIYKTRSQIAEFPHLWIKAKLGVRQFRVRGVPKVQSESVWAALTYNLQQWIRLRWRPQFAATAT